MTPAVRKAPLRTPWKCHSAGISLAISLIEVMLMCQGRLFVTRLFALTLLLILSACGQQSGAPRWASFPVPLYADSTVMNNEQKLTDLKEAMSFWESKSGRKLFDFRGTYQSKTAPFKGSNERPEQVVANVIFFQSPWPHAANVIGETVVSLSGSRIMNAMIRINGEVPFCEGDCVGDFARSSQKKNFAHELGHFLGLEHVQDVEDVMNPVIQPGGSLAKIEVDMEALAKVTQ
jgi:hypothetical protein